MIIARNLEYLSQVEATIRYSRKLAALGRLSAGGAVAAVEPPTPEAAQAMQHVEVIAGEIRRLDEVVQGFLKFTRPEDLKLQPVRLEGLFDEVVRIVQPEADRAGVNL